MGDPAKAAEKMYALTELPDPPLRLALGEDCIAAIRNKLSGVNAELDKYASWSKDLSVDSDKRDGSPSKRRSSETKRAPGIAV